MSSTKAVKDVYLQVVVDVVNGVREAFLDEGMDEQVLLELKELWERKLSASKALEVNEPRVVHHAAQQQLVHRAPVAHHHQQPVQQIQAAAAAPTATLQPMNPMQIVAATSPMTASAQAAGNALPAGLYQQLQQQRLQHAQYEYCSANEM